MYLHPLNTFYFRDNMTMNNNTMIIICIHINVFMHTYVNSYKHVQ